MSTSITPAMDRDFCPDSPTGVAIIRRGKAGAATPTRDTWTCADCGTVYRLTGPDAPTPIRTLHDDGWWFASPCPQCSEWNWAVVYDPGSAMWRLTHRVYHRVWLVGVVLVAVLLASDLAFLTLGLERGGYAVAGLIVALLLAFQLADAR